MRGTSVPRTSGTEVPRGLKSAVQGWPGALVALAACGVAAFYGSYRLYFLSDDFLLLKHSVSAWEHPWVRFVIPGGDGFYRPVGYLALGLSAPWSDSNPLPWHLAGLALHAVNAVLVWLLAARLRLSRLGSWLAAVLFVVHGSRPESVVWLAGRFDLLATLFVLLGLVAFLRSWHAAGVVAMTVAILSKESAYAFPLILMVFVAVGLAHWRAMIPYFAVAGGLFMFRLSLFHGTGGYGTVSVFPAIKALAWRLWAVLFFPVNWAWPAGPVLLVMLAIYAAALALLFTARVPRRQLLLGIGFTVAAAIPAVQQLLIGPDLQKSRILYLPSIGFCLLIGMAAENIAPRLAIAAAVAVLAFQFTALRHNIGAWAYAAEKVRTTCETADPKAKPPGSLNGVYFLANGFEECIEISRPSRPKP